MKLTKTLALAAILATLSVPAFAQRGQGGGMRGIGGGQQAGWMLLGRADVQEDLKITDEQKAKLDAMREEMMSSMRERMGRGGGERPSREEMQKQREAMEKEVSEKLAAILTPAQMTRMKQISIQMGGPAAAFRGETAKELSITEAQRTQFEELQQKVQRANRAIFQKVQDGETDRETAMESVRKNGETLNAELEKILTADQKAKLKAMGGAPFTRRDENR